MKILLINSEYPPIGGGASNASANLAREFVRLGHQVTVLTSSFAHLSRDETIDGVRIVRLPSLRSRADRSSTIEQIAFMLSAALLGLATTLRWRPKVVLAFFGAPSGVAPWLWSFFSRTPYVVSLRGGDVPGFRPYDFAHQHRLLSPLLRSVWKRAAAVVANSAGLRELARKFEPTIEVSVISNGVDLDAFKDEPRQWSPVRMLFVGRVVYQKGLDLLFTALTSLKDAEWELNIAGDGPRVDDLKAQARELGIDKKVTFLGWQTSSQLPGVLLSANLFVHPSRHEGMPNALLEAMASGLPAVATRIAGNEELVSAETGVLVPTEDPQALRAALLPLLEDAALREKMGRAARKRVAAEYSWRQVAQAYLDLMTASIQRK